MIEELISNELLKKLSHEWVDMFIFPFTLEDYVESGVLNIEEEFDVDNLINNLEERIHCRIESGSGDMLRRLRNLDRKMVDDDECMLSMCMYISFQYMRTPSLRNSLIQNMSEFYEDINSCIGLLATIFSTNAAWGYYRNIKNARFEFLKTNEHNSFITGDHPVVNLNGAPDENGNIPTNVILYYPLTPLLSMKLELEPEEAGWFESQVSPSEVDRLNQIIANYSNLQIYGISKELVERIKSTERAWT